MALFALYLPLLLLPLAGYAVDSTLLSARSAVLRGAVDQAAEDAVQVVDVARLRSSGRLFLAPAEAQALAADSLRARDPAAALEHVTVTNEAVTLVATEEVRLAFGGFLGAGSVTLSATARARLRPGYFSPSNLAPFP